MLRKEGILAWVSVQEYYGALRIIGLCTSADGPRFKKKNMIVIKMCDGSCKCGVVEGLQGGRVGL